MAPQTSVLAVFSVCCGVLLACSTIAAATESSADRAERTAVSGVPVTASELGYHVLAGSEAFGCALQKLPEPVAGKVCRYCA